MVKICVLYHVVVALHIVTFYKCHGLSTYETYWPWEEWIIDSIDSWWTTLVSLTTVLFLENAMWINFSDSRTSLTLGSLCESHWSRVLIRIQNVWSAEWHDLQRMLLISVFPGHRGPPPNQVVRIWTGQSCVFYIDSFSNPVEISSMWELFY